METLKYECDEYYSKLYIDNENILLCDIFLRNKNQNRLEIEGYMDNIIQYRKYTVKTKYRPYRDSVQFEKTISNNKIELNKAFPLLSEYNIYNIQYSNMLNANVILVAFIKKEFFTGEHNANKI